MPLSSLNQDFGLSLETLEKIRQVFSQHPHLERAILYGSRAKGNYRPGSDIDLTLIGDALNALELAQIENELEELLLPYIFDLSLFKEISSADLLDHIARMGQVFYSKAHSL